MSRPLRTISLLLPVLAAAWLLPARASACSCVPPPPPKKALAGATAVFEGKVASIEEDPGQHRSTATLEVSRVWKGAVTATVKVKTQGAGSMCGFSFAVGESYLVYADGEPGGLSTSLCSRSAGSKAARDDFKALGTSKPPVAAPEPAAPEPAKPVAPAEPVKPIAAAPVEPAKPIAGAPVEPAKPATPEKQPTSATSCAVDPAGHASAVWLAAVLLWARRRRPRS